MRLIESGRFSDAKLANELLATLSASHTEAEKRLAATITLRIRHPVAVDAQILAVRLHAGQTDKAGQPYIDHLTRVAAILVRRWPNDVSSAEINAAWLHDALEDTDVTSADLLAADVSPRAVQIVQALTRPAGVTYLDWIRDLAASGDLGVIRVKLADNEDNRDPVRVAALPGAAEMVELRYEPARLLLEAALSADGRR